MRQPYWILLLPFSVLFLVSLACVAWPETPLDEGYRLRQTEDAQLPAWDPAWEAETEQPAATAAPQQAAGPQSTQALPTLPAGLPQIWLDYTGPDKPMYRSALLGAIDVDNTRPVPWPAHMRTHVERDYQSLGALQPGTVKEDSTFEGSYDPKLGLLSGTINHHVVIEALATDEFLAFTHVYHLTCQIEARLDPATNTLQGTCSGQVSEEHVVPAESNHNFSKQSTVSIPVSAPMPDDLQP